MPVSPAVPAGKSNSSLSRRARTRGLLRGATAAALSLAPFFAAPSVSVAQTPGGAPATQADPFEAGPGSGVSIPPANPAGSLPTPGELQARIERARKALTEATQRLSRGDAELLKQRQELQQAERELRAGHDAADQARARFEAAKSGYESARRTAVAEFERGEAFRSAKAAADAAKAEATAAEEAALRQLAATDAYRRAEEDVARTEQRLHALSGTQPATSPDRADASQMAAESKVRLADLRERFLKDDQRVRETRPRATETAAAFDRLRQEFGEKLPQLPAVAAAQGALDAAQSTGVATDADLQRAQSHRDELAAAVNKADGALEPDRAAMRNLQAELNELNRAVATARANADRIRPARAAPVAQATPQLSAAAPPSAPPQAPLTPFDPYGPGDDAPPTAAAPQIPQVPQATPIGPPRQPVQPYGYSYTYFYPYAVVPVYPSPPDIVIRPGYYRAKRHYDYVPRGRDILHGGGWYGGYRSYSPSCYGGGYRGREAYGTRRRIHVCRSYRGSAGRNRGR